jgi:hypothetical protein
MKDEDAFRIASSLERIATRLDQLNEMLRRRALAPKTSIPNWAWAIGLIGVAVLIFSVMRT